MVKRVDIALAVSKKSEESGFIRYEGGFIGESGNYYPFEISQSYRRAYVEMLSRGFGYMLESQYYDKIDKSCYTSNKNNEIIYKESIFINE